MQYDEEEYGDVLCTWKGIKYSYKFTDQENLDSPLGSVDTGPVMKRQPTAAGLIIKHINAVN